MVQLSLTEASPPDSFFISSSFYLGVATILSWTFHLTIFYVMATDKKLWSPINTVLINLAVSDFCISVFGNPVAFICAFAGNWIFSSAICVTYGFLMGLFGITSIITLTVLAFERYLIICCPFSSSAHFTVKGAKISVIGIWVYSFILTSPPLFGWGQYELEATHISCSVNWETRSTNATSYISFLFILALILPVFIICFSYLQIIRAVSQAQKVQNKMKEGARYKKKDAHVAVMILLMIIMFLVAWGPYAIASGIIAATDWYVSPFFATFPSLFAKGSCCFNPIIYFLFNPMFRNSLKAKLGIQKKKETVEESPEVKHILMAGNREDQNITDSNYLQATALDSTHGNETRKTSIVSITSSNSPSDSDNVSQNLNLSLFPNRSVPAQRKTFLLFGKGSSKNKPIPNEGETERILDPKDH